ncbi:putative protein phosphatase 2C 14 [Hibiscus syriacus]|uniref:protein-serine/threonine phosphatase n=1 Tax=Hibiscus syriacus TaxID=106335 RepID=A0A6A3B0I4_HIBSY|nr:probable protein phosphatase 2C 14 [Hibiscus syriacus]KAE8710226.1 putative protein phosphatase 2C 14 [Hibiscus syriacus]
MTNKPSSVSLQPNEKPHEQPVLYCNLKRKRPPTIEIPNVLQEIQVNSLKVKDFTPRDDTVCFSGLGVAVYSVKGKKKFMEDAHKIVSCLHGNSNKAFFGVYDGHGGKDAADFVAQNLHNNLFEMLKDCKGNDEKEEAVKSGYLKTDEEFLKKDMVSGTCCVTALIEGDAIVVSNLGDCRAVLSREGVAEALTTDHKAEQQDERTRIENKGGYVEFHRGAWRVHGILSVSRSIGDAHLKDWVVAEPDTKVFQLTPDMEYLVLASDGLWEEVSEQEAIDTVTRLSVAKRTDNNGGHSKENDEDYGRVSVSPSKIRRISLVKQQQKDTCQSPRYKNNIDGWKDNDRDVFACENRSPPSKFRRISMVKRISTKLESPTQENTSFKKKPSSAAGIMAACKELVSLAVNRGSLDDITVMIIDLNHFKCNI